MAEAKLLAVLERYPELRAGVRQHFEEVLALAELIHVFGSELVEPDEPGLVSSPPIELAPPGYWLENGKTRKATLAELRTAIACTPSTATSPTRGARGERARRPDRDELAGLVAAFESAIEQVVDEKLCEALEGLSEPASPWLTLIESADYLRVSESTMERAVARHRVRSSTIGRRRLFHRDDLDALAAGEEKREPLRPRRRGVEGRGGCEPLYQRRTPCKGNASGRPTRGVGTSPVFTAATIVLSPATAAPPMGAGGRVCSTLTR